MGRHRLKGGHPPVSMEREGLCFGSYRSILPELLVVELTSRCLIKRREFIIEVKRKGGGTSKLRRATALRRTITRVSIAQKSHCHPNLIAVEDSSVLVAKTELK